MTEEREKFTALSYKRLLDICGPRLFVDDASWQRPMLLLFCLCQFEHVLLPHYQRRLLELQQSALYHNYQEGVNWRTVASISFKELPRSFPQPGSLHQWELSHIAIPICKRGWSSCVKRARPRIGNLLIKNKTMNIWRQVAISTIACRRKWL